MVDDASALVSWNARYERHHANMMRRHSPACTEILMKGYRCMKRSGGVRSECQQLFDELTQCRSPEGLKPQRKPTV